MPLQSSGLIKLSQIQSEFGGSNPISLTEYYRNGAYVTANNTGVPTSGVISVTSFYGTGRAFYLTISSNTENADIASLATTAGWNGSDFLEVTVNSSVYLWSDTTSTAGAIISGSFPGGLVLKNYGKIIGKGGQGGNYTNGNGYAGGPALSIASSNVTINNLSGAYIAGGGGGGKAFDRAGGGGGAGGGRGGNTNASYASGGAGGALGQMGASGSGWASPDSSKGGSAGGQGGYTDENSSGSTYGSGGGGGGRILPGTTSPVATAGRSTLLAAGRGGAGGVAGGSRAQSGNGLRGGGGGGWGAAGGSSGGGAAGKAIEPNGNAYTLNDSGTIFGATT